VVDVVQRWRFAATPQSMHLSQHPAVVFTIASICCMHVSAVHLQVAQRWRFAATPTALQKHGKPVVLPNARVQDVGSALAAKSYQVCMPAVH
jgi:hypothetical protein